MKDMPEVRELVGSLRSLGVRPGDALGHWVSLGKSQRARLSRLCIGKLAPNGDYISSASFGTSLNIFWETGIVADAFNNIVVFDDGSRGSLDFGGGSLGGNMHFGKLGPFFGHLWSYGMGSANSAIRDVAIGSNGNVAIVGTFNGSLTLGPNNFAAQGSDAFVAVYSP